jgi:hypothetical protein
MEIFVSTKILDLGGGGGSRLTVRDVENAVKAVRKKAYEKKK